MDVSHRNGPIRKTLNPVQVAIYRALKIGIGLGFLAGLMLGILLGAR